LVVAKVSGKLALDSLDVSKPLKPVQSALRVPAIEELNLQHPAKGDRVSLDVL
jgi:hypothetical protein